MKAVAWQGEANHYLVYGVGTFTITYDDTLIENRFWRQGDE